MNQCSPDPVDPDAGTKTFTYDVLGELLTQTDARRVSTSHRYDVLSRSFERTATDTVAIAPLPKGHPRHMDHGRIAPSKLRAPHGLSVPEIEAVLVTMAQHAIALSPERTALQAPDPGDQRLWELLASRDDLVLVSGDARLLAASDFPTRLWTPARFVQ